MGPLPHASAACFLCLLLLSASGPGAQGYDSAGHVADSTLDDAGSEEDDGFFSKSSSFRQTASSTSSSGGGGRGKGTPVDADADFASGDDAAGGMHDVAGSGGAGEIGHV